MAHGSAKELRQALCDDRPVWDAWLAVYRLPSLTVADELGLFTSLKKSPLTTA